MQLQASVDCIYGGWPCTLLSVQELMNHVHQVIQTPEMLEPDYVIPPDGAALSAYDAFNYVQNFGIPSAQDYPFVGVVEAVDFDARPQGVMRVYLDDFDSIFEGRMTTRMMCNRIKRMIEHAPVPAVVLYCDSFDGLHDEIYMGPTSKEKRYVLIIPRKLIIIPFCSWDMASRMTSRIVCARILTGQSGESVALESWRSKQFYKFIVQRQHILSSREFKKGLREACGVLNI